MNSHESKGPSQLTQVIRVNQMVHLVLQSTRRNRRSWAYKSINGLRERDVCNFSSYSDFRMSALRTPRYYGQELKSRDIRITENNSHYYGHQILVLMVSVIAIVDCIYPKKKNAYSRCVSTRCS